MLRLLGAETQVKSEHGPRRSWRESQMEGTGHKGLGEEGYWKIPGMLGLVGGGGLGMVAET